MRVSDAYPERTDTNGITWYRPIFEGGAPPRLWGWTSNPEYAHPSYSAPGPQAAGATT